MSSADVVIVLTKLETPQGFGAETSSAVVILAASQAG